VKKASEYRRHAEECRNLAKAISNPEHLAALAKMTEAWESLARKRVERIARDKRMASLEGRGAATVVPEKVVSGPGTKDEDQCCIASQSARPTLAAQTTQQSISFRRKSSGRVVR
jgi:hypothetical protein